MTRRCAALHDPRHRLVVRPDDHEVLQRELGDVRVRGAERRDRAAERARLQIGRFISQIYESNQWPEVVWSGELAQTLGLDSIQAAITTPTCQ